MHQQYIHLSGVPGLLILHALIHPDPQLFGPDPVVLLNALQDAVLVVLVAVECEAMLPVQLLQQLRESLQLAVMDRDHLAVIAVHSPVAELQQLAHQPAVMMSSSTSSSRSRSNWS